jgi:hypothetical protein
MFLALEVAVVAPAAESEGSPQGQRQRYTERDGPIEQQGTGAGSSRGRGGGRRRGSGGGMGGAFAGRPRRLSRGCVRE